MQAFTSTKTTSMPGIVYWQASFQSTEVPGRVGFAPGIVATKPRVLMVRPAPAPPMAAPPPAPAFSAAISSVPTGRQRVAFEVHCSSTCVGTAGYVVTVTHRRRKSREGAMDSGPWLVSIASTVGGSERFAHRYTGGALRKLERLIRAGDTLEAQITATIMDDSGDTSVARTTARLG